jgi:uncharacterized phage infection (PIP) family protein YhgE
MRYAREYAAWQKNLGIQLMDKQLQVRDKQNELLAVKQQMSNTVQEVIIQRRQLTREHSIAKANAAELRKKQKEIEKQVAEQQKQLNALNKKIDDANSGIRILEESRSRYYVELNKMNKLRTEREKEKEKERKEAEEMAWKEHWRKEREEAAKKREMEKESNNG